MKEPEWDAPEGQTGSCMECERLRAMVDAALSHYTLTANLGDVAPAWVLQARNLDKAQAPKDTARFLDEVEEGMFDYKTEPPPQECEACGGEGIIEPESGDAALDTPYPCPECSPPQESQAGDE